MRNTMKLSAVLVAFSIISAAAHAGPSYLRKQKPPAAAWGYQFYDDVWQGLGRGWKYMFGDGGPARWTTTSERAKQKPARG
jgi:hypothetical protein